MARPVLAASRLGGWVSPPAGPGPSGSRPRRCPGPPRAHEPLRDRGPHGPKQIRPTRAGREAEAPVTPNTQPAHSRHKFEVRPRRRRLPGRRPKGRARLGSVASRRACENTECRWTRTHGLAPAGGIAGTGPGHARSLSPAGQYAEAQAKRGLGGGTFSAQAAAKAAADSDAEAHFESENNQL